MERKRRTQILVGGSPELAARLAGQIAERHDVHVMEEPQAGLVMVKVRETARKSLFYIGEVLVTECKAVVAGEIGIGLVRGHEPERAYHLAVIDAAYRAKLEETGAWTRLLAEEEERLGRERERSRSAILKTKVSFETMNDD